MNPNIEIQTQNLTEVAQQAKQTVQGSEVATQRQEAEAHEIEMELIKAQELADRQEAAQTEGREAERRIESVGQGA